MLILLTVFRPDAWNGILDATKHSASPAQDPSFMDGLSDYLPIIAYQDPKTYSEDCLYLSVYTSKPSATAKLPVS